MELSNKDNSIYIKDNIVYCFGKINMDLALNFCRALDYSYNGYDEIIIKINSPGGYLMPAISMYNTIKAKSEFTRIITIGEGVVASSATFIFQAGNIRILRPNSVYLMHPLKHISTGPKHTDLDDTLHNFEIYKDIMTNMFCSDKLSKKQLFKLMRDEKFMTPDLALRYNLCDLVTY